MTYRCERCGYATAKWMGFCPQCRAQGSLTEARGGSVTPVSVASAAASGGPRRQVVGIGEVDRVLGGGMVPGSVVLVGGEPGVGKSTLLLQIARASAEAGTVLYVTAEESAAQIAERAVRVGAATADRLLVLPEGDVDAIERALDATHPVMVVIDSVQTTRVAEVDGLPGGVSQVRESGARFTAVARRLGVPVLLVGHVTKEGVLAGPKVLEHLVDVVLYLEGDPDRGLRYLRGLKNRYGSISQVGVFEMTAEGMVEVSDPTGVFVGGWTGAVPGTIVFPAMYGRRSLLVEVQALVAGATTPHPRRSVKGLDPTRIHQLLAVLERHADVDCGKHDVYVNVVGGLTLTDPGGDLAATLAIASSRLGVAFGGVAAFGEVGLAGEVRSSGDDERRRQELARFGITRAIGGAEAATVAEALAAAGAARTAAREVRLVSSR